MPHRVATFFRASSHSVDLLEKEFTKAAKGSISRNKPALNRSLSPPQHSSGPDDRNTRLQESHKRIHIPGLYSPRSCSQKLLLATSSLDVEIESPPLVFYGPTTTSSGALLSGQLILQVQHETIAIESFKMSLDLELTHKRPHHTHCRNCRKHKTVLESWVFLNVPTTLPKGLHKFPFSWILPGHLPASTQGTLFQIEYNLHAELALSGVEPVKLCKELDIRRAIMPPDGPRSSTRIFPPTDLTAYCQHPTAIHPIGTSTVSIRIDGCVKKSVDASTQRQWKLKKLYWHLEEKQRITSPPCSKHAMKRPGHEGEDKGVTHTDVRIIGEGYFRMGWKSDFSVPDGRIEVEFPFAIRPGAQPLCDMKSDNDTEVSHSLVVQMVFIEEIMSKLTTSEDIPTGAARVLRMHFNVIVTERSGLGISWDAEQPPLYENVPMSPPRYEKTTINEIDSIPTYQSLSSTESLGSSLDQIRSVAHTNSTPLHGIPKILCGSGRPAMMT
ncbi:BgTH12-07064 [Blumeria graminis f. sp. triticale]|uniref:Bgt-3722 n=3 Tax=Blumeria graminis TaxID=34373 RepID=A0A061HJS0_BLUGR|nr:hypothetical protein BGT96224_3722 [Blumeria graminis f. sp. tritici 96224]CAD6506134.1 BgTH12-07064 [Blumeria graminis f. sp. triticale]VDB94829.1 Bgt-3722 [Blumeria graminis f. sp. tritici]